MTLKEWLQLWASPLGVVVAVLLAFLVIETFTDRRVKSLDEKLAKAQDELEAKLANISTDIADYASGAKAMSKIYLQDGDHAIMISPSVIRMSYKNEEKAELSVYADDRSVLYLGGDEEEYRARLYSYGDTAEMSVRNGDKMAFTIKAQAGASGGREESLP